MLFAAAAMRIAVARGLGFAKPLRNTSRNISWWSGSTDNDVRFNPLFATIRTTEGATPTQSYEA